MQAKNGDKIKVHYTLKLDGGDVVESSVGTEPLEFTIGKGEMIRGFESGVTGMRVGEKKTITVPAAEAYGERNEKKVFEYNREMAPPEFEPQIGQKVRMHRPDGKEFIVTVMGVNEKSFIMDANHPLSGKDLTFDLDLVEIINQF
ncbi:MAG: FKBP-type peptidyl-prolyl cis-trans isomerase [Nitrospirae bacterium]|nr:FKBP-type peptidyl-prolyl cis-trans isomerase [Nitrospirota bacterium]